MFSYLQYTSSYCQAEAECETDNNIEDNQYQQTRYYQVLRNMYPLILKGEDLIMVWFYCFYLISNPMCKRCPSQKIMSP